MLDLVPNNSRLSDIRDGIQYDHSDPFDLSLFTDRAVFERVPIEAQTYWEDKTPYGDTIQQVVEPTKIDNYHAVLNKATGQLVDMRPIPKTYQLVPHQDMMKVQAQQLADSPLGGRLRVVDRLFEAGKKAHRTIYFEDLKADVRSRQGSDSVVPRLDVFNSIDMSWSFQVFSGAYRDLCRNTLVFGGEKAYHQKRRHTRNLDTSALTGKAVLSLDMFQNQREQMDRWASLGLSSRQFIDVLSETICKRKARPSDGEEQPVNKSLLNYLGDQFEEEAKELGETMWAGYNALTHWSTHTLEKGREKQKQHDAQRKRADMVRDVLTSEPWQVLEGVAA
tara:strand:- start:2052 stop:3056 length:1005 start_codon:yes stop_codon:yes gene_type:complete